MTHLREFRSFSLKQPCTFPHPHQRLSQMRWGNGPGHGKGEGTRAAEGSQPEKEKSNRESGKKTSKSPHVEDMTWISANIQMVLGGMVTHTPKQAVTFF